MSDTVIETAQAENRAGAQPAQGVVDNAAGDITNAVGNKVIVPIRGMHAAFAKQVINSPEQAASMSNRRWAAYRAAAERGAAAGAGVATAEQAHERIVEEQTRVAVSGVKGSAAAASFVARQLDTTQARHGGDTIQAGTVNVVNMTFTAPSMSVEEMSRAARAYLEQQAQAGAE